MTGVAGIASVREGAPARRREAQRRGGWLACAIACIAPQSDAWLRQMAVEIRRRNMRGVPTTTSRDESLGQRRWAQTRDAGALSPVGHGQGMRLPSLFVNRPSL
jgi:hypothetical protein